MEGGKEEGRYRREGGRREEEHELHEISAN